VSFIIAPSRFSSGIGPASPTYAGFKTASFAASVSVASVALGTPASDRRVFVLVGIKPGGTYRALSSATIGGVAATIHGQTADTTYKYNVALISAAVPAGTTGTVVLNFSGSGSGNVYLASYAVSGLSSAVAVDFDAKSYTPAQQAVTQTSTIEVSAGGIALFGACVSVSDVDLVLSGVTENFEQVIDTKIRFVGGCAAVVSDDASYDITTTSGNGTYVHYDRALAASFR
jgi:hypothetical protein